MKLDERLDKIAEILDKNKAQNIQKFNLLGSEYLTDGVVIASAMANKHLFALVDYLKTDLKPQEEFLHVESSDEWIVADLGDIIVHIMSDLAREKYHLEEFLDKFEATIKS